MASESPTRPRTSPSSRPVVEHPDQHPDQGPHRDRLRAEDDRHGHHPAHPAGGGRPDGVGVTGIRRPRHQPLPQGLARLARRLPRRADGGLLLQQRDGRASVRPPPFAADRQPDDLHRRRPLPVELAVPTYQDPDNPSHAEADYPATTGCENEIFNPVFNVALDHRETDSASGLNLQLKAPQFLGFANSPSTIRSAIVILPEGFTINPDAADGQQACTDAQANFDTEGPADCPDNAKIGTFEIDTPALDGPLDRLDLHRRTEAGQPVPALHDRPRLRHPRQARRIRPARSEDRPADDQRRRPAAGPVRKVRPAPVRLRPRPDGDADALHDLPGRRALHPLERRGWRRRHSKPIFSLTSGPNGGPCPGQVRPFNPRLVAGTSNPVAGAFSELHPEARPRRRRPVPRRPQLQDAAWLHRRPAGHQLLPGGGDRGRRAEPRPRRAAPSRAARPRARSAPPTSPPAPAATPSTRSGKMYLAGPVQGRAARASSRSPRPWPGPMTTASVVVRVALHVDPARPPRSTAVSDTVPSIIGGHPDPDALDPGQHRQAQLHDQPDQLLALHGRLAGDRRPGHGHRLLLLLPRGQLRDAAASSRR